ncbi:response regulator [bacterium]|nr:response regulator [bacterium]
MKLLIIDDQPQVTDSLKEAIEPGGHECVIYNDPQKAVNCFEKEYFDAVLTDLKMPEMDGIQVLKTIQKFRPGTPVIILTGYADTQNAIEAVNLGAHAFFQKPVQIQDLLESLRCIEMKQQEEMVKEIKINRLQAEKETMSDEMKQRINQNLQLISSLLRLQSGKLSNPEAQRALKAAHQRILTMALIHERMYSEKNHAKMDLADYIERYMNSFTQTHQLSQKQIQVVLKLDPVSVDINHAIPWGLVFNELISNAIMHAFPDSNNGSNRIEISLKRDKTNAIILSIEDNGKGMNVSKDMDNCDSLGMNLITNIVRYQLNGDITFSNDSGIHVKVTSQN